MSKGAASTQLEAVLFDVDGTLVNTVDMIVRGIQESFAGVGLPLPSAADVRARTGLPLPDHFRSYSEFQTQAASDQSRTLPLMVSLAMERFAAYEHETKPFTDAVRGFRYLRSAGIPVGLVTSKSRREFETFATCFSDFADVPCVITATDVSRPKPAPDPVWAASALLNVPVDRCVFIGDSIFDLRSGRDAGAMTAAVGYGAGQRTELLAEQPDFFFPTPLDLYEWITNAFNDQPCLANP